MLFQNGFQNSNIKKPPLIIVLEAVLFPDGSKTVCSFRYYRKVLELCCFEWFPKQRPMLTQNNLKVLELCCFGMVPKR